VGRQKNGSFNVQWDGTNQKGEKQPHGEYSFSVQASSVDGTPIIAESSFLTKVNGISDVSKSGKIETPIGILEPSQIISVRNQSVENEI
jgi:flagellar hook assembly protein FlgD